MNRKKPGEFSGAASEKFFPQATTANTPCSWVLLQIGSEMSDSEINNFATTFVQCAIRNGYELNPPRNIISTVNLPSAINELTKVMMTKTNDNSNVCMTVSSEPEQHVRAGLIPMFGQVCRIYTLSVEKVQNSLKNASFLNKMVDHFAKFNSVPGKKSETKQEGPLNPGRPSKPLIPIKRSNSSWIFVSVGGGDELDSHTEREFCDVFAQTVQKKGYDLKKVLMRKRVASDQQAVTVIRQMITANESCEAASCIVTKHGDQSEVASLRSTLIKAFGRQLRFFTIGSTHVTACLRNQMTLGKLTESFTHFCQISKKNAVVASVVGCPSEPEDAAVQKKLATYPMKVDRLKNMCDRLDSGSLQPGSSDLLQALTADGSFYERIKYCGQNGPNVESEVFDHIFQLVAASCKFNFDQFKENVNELLVKILDTPGFLAEAIEKHIQPLEFEAEMLGNRSDFEQQKLSTAIKNQLTVMCLLLDRFPTRHATIRSTVNTARLLLKQEEVRSQDQFFDAEMKKLCERMDAAWKFAADRAKPQLPTASKQEITKRKVLPPVDFRKISICPAKEEVVHADKPFLRSNVVKGSYEDSEHYLDVQFRLLREDFVGPLREGIANFLTKTDRKSGLYVYRGVTIQSPKIDKKTGLMVHQVRFNQMPRARWTKRLKYGSMVCLSSDNFENDLLFATVYDRSPEMLKNGELWLNFEFAGDHGENKFSRERQYVMAESSAYFEAYRHVLKGLQAIPQSEALPFEKYFVFCDTTLAKPAYLEAHPVIDFQSLVKDAKDAYTADVFNPNTWPTMEEMGFDQSQYEAMKLGLSSELALIQGPPGTGKTFIGHQLTKLLLLNRKTLFNKEETTPILVVCYTNHALDQFLEGIVEFTNEIIRIGGQCKNENLKEYCLYLVRQHNRDKIPGDLRFSINQTRSQQYLLQDEIDFIIEVLKCLTVGMIPKFSLLRPYLSDDHAEQLERSQLRRQSDRLEEWLITPSEERAVYYKKSRNHMNVPLVRYLMEMGIPEMIAKKALYLNGNVDPAAAHYWVYQNWGLPIMNVTVHEIAHWPTIRAVDSVVAMGFPEEDACWALEEHRTIHKALEQLKQAFGDEQPKQQHDMELPEDFPNESSMRIDLGDQILEEDNEDEYRLLEDDLGTFDISVRGKLDAERQSLEMFFPKCTMMQQQLPNSYVQERLDYLTPMIMAEQPMNEVRANYLGAIWSLPLRSRWQLYQFWIRKLKPDFEEKLRAKELEYGQLSVKIRHLISMGDLELLKSASVIGMTTTGAAQNQAVLQSIGPKIVIMEEAAEVLEAHLVTSLSSSCQHVILIGDHQQLRPSPSVYELTKNYHLDISLFERLINNGFKAAMLNLQHRMRPEISGTLMPHFYPNLMDDESVKNYENVLGMKMNMVFLNHNYPETEDKDSRSHMNEYEVQLAVGLCQYLLKQEYTKDQITVLCTYLDQMIAIKKFMKVKTVEGIRVTVVDNYQGEESDIIIASLVRSNNEGHIGFLKVKNRVCVAMSRAKIGFYCLANFDHMVESSTKFHENGTPWRNIVQYLQRGGYLRESFPIICHMHDTEQEVKSFEEFQVKSPEGGCQELCKIRIERCGHTCDKPCHPYDLDHTQMPCNKPCARYCPQPEHHRCKKDCYQECGNCLELVLKELPCGHKQVVECYLEPDAVICQESCQKVLNCGHTCAKFCNEPCTTECAVNVTKSLPCGHVINAACHLNSSEIKCNHEVTKMWPFCGHELSISCHVDPNNSLCPAPCAQPLPECGHLCAGSCGQCRSGRLHVRCSADCNRILVCGHVCTYKCSHICPPCTQPCETQCMHSVCSASKIKPKHAKKSRGRMCGDLCPLCNEDCGWVCRHHKCEKRCWEPCEREPCAEPCLKELQCGTEDEPHFCIGVCGEPCPNVCRMCNPEKMEEIQEVFFGTEDEPNALFIQLADCGHIIEMTAIDTWVKKQTEPDENSQQEGQRDQTIEVLCCPKCKKPIRKSLRFGHNLKQRQLDIEKIKLKIKGAPINQLEDQRCNLIQKLILLDNRIRIEGCKRLFPNLVNDDSVTVESAICELRKSVEKPESKHLTIEKIGSWKTFLGFLEMILDFGQEGKLRQLFICLNRVKDSLMANKKALPKLAVFTHRYFAVNRSMVKFLYYERQFLVNWIFTNHNSASQLMMDQFNSEIQRFMLIAQIVSLIYRAYQLGTSCKFTDSEYDAMGCALEVLFGSKPIHGKIEGEVQQSIEKLTKVLDIVPGTGITRQERTQIIAAVGLQRGHWYKCPKGHIYSIADCGRPMVISQCPEPECGSSIGGQNHELETSNERADELMFDRPFYD